jgi:plastocyanin
LTLGVATMAVMALFGARGSLISAQEEAPHLAHIHAGTCDTLDPNPSFPLGDISDQFLEDGEAAVGDEVGSGASATVKGSQTTVETTIDDLLASDFAINAHESAEAADVYIACGNISGSMVGDELIIGLAEQNDSGHTGVAILTPNGESTVVTVYLVEAPGDEAAADGGDDGATAGGEPVEIVDFAFGPAELTVPVGTTVTWTNQDSAPHTATGDDGSFDSGRLDQGQSFSFTFEAAGSFPYHCDFHPNMVATITVE